jgi:hypothetical protein
MFQYKRIDALIVSRGKDENGMLYLYVVVEVTGILFNRELKLPEWLALVPLLPMHSNHKRVPPSLLTS